MNKPILLTPKQQEKKVRDEQLVKEYFSMQGAKTAIIEHLHKKFDLSAPRIYVIIRKATSKS